jgi:hypothetical protein
VEVVNKIALNTSYPTLTPCPIFSHIPSKLLLIKFSPVGAIPLKIYKIEIVLYDF